MPKERIVSFNEAQRISQNYQRKHLLLGNGFSIAKFSNIFSYDSIFKEDDFLDRPAILKVFKANASRDFEEAIRTLNNAAKVLRSYPGYSQDQISQIEDDAEFIKATLLKSLARSHPELPTSLTDDDCRRCATFLENFLARSSSQTQASHVYTLNYDLLLYWTLMRTTNRELELPRLETNDGFGSPEYSAEYVVWNGEKTGFYQRVFFLHGALHLFDTDTEVRKTTWSRSDVRLIDQTREFLNNNEFPIFVAEGSSIEKLKKIRHNPYLESCMTQFIRDVGLSNVNNSCLFIYGHSLNSTDDHILKQIWRGNLGHVFISVYGSFDSSSNQLLLENFSRLKRTYGSSSRTSFTFFDATSAHVWT